MKRIRCKSLWPLLLVVALGAMQSCDEEEDCSLNARPMMTCNLYQANPETAGAFIPDTLEQLTITAYGTDSIILNREQKVKALTLPLCYSADSTHLVFHYEDGATDEVIILHDNTPYFLSMECGYQKKQAKRSVIYTKVRLDSIAISYNEAGIYGRVNLKLYF